jgi:hypothetical protein
MRLDWSAHKPKLRKPTYRQVGLYKGWRKYLRNSRLDPEEQHYRAAQMAEDNRPVPDD